MSTQSQHVKCKWEGLNCVERPGIKGDWRPWWLPLMTEVPNPMSSRTLPRSTLWARRHGCGFPVIRSFCLLGPHWVGKKAMATSLDRGLCAQFKFTPSPPPTSHLPPANSTLNSGSLVFLYSRVDKIGWRLFQSEHKKLGLAKNKLEVELSQPM